MESNDNSYEIDFSKPHLYIQEIDSRFLSSDSDLISGSQIQSNYDSSSDDDVQSQDDWNQIEKVYFMEVDGFDANKDNPEYTPYLLESKVLHSIESSTTIDYS